jgi:hypothetical protein
MKSDDLIFQSIGGGGRGERVFYLDGFETNGMV